MIVLVDQDGPLADFEGGFLSNWRAHYPNEGFIPFEQRKSFQLKDDYPKHLETEVHGIYSVPGFYLGLEPVQDACDAVKEMIASGLEVFICTSPLSRYEDCVLEKYRWVEKWLGRDFTKRIILTKDKTLVKGDFLIDDRPAVLGVAKPEWEHVLYDYPFNRNVKMKRRVTWDNWKEVLLS